VSTAVWKKFSI